MGITNIGGHMKDKVNLFYFVTLLNIEGISIEEK